MHVLPLGKAPWSLLVELVKKQGFKHDGIIQTAEQGVDVAVLDLNSIINEVSRIYNTQSTPYLVYKADPITFPTPNPANYLIIVNKNDLATAGALPYGITVTILLPPDFTAKSLLELQSNLSDICEKQQISILGGHTEITEVVQKPVLSASMIGFVPPEYYIPREPQVGDSIICSGWAGAEGTGILLTEAPDIFTKYLDRDEYKQGIEVSTHLDISPQVIECNKRWHDELHLVHDATEGGIVGALYECLAPKGFGSKITSENIPVASSTKKIAKFLNINPYKLISSGAVVYICSSHKASEIREFLTQKNYIAEIVGKVTEKGAPILIDGTPAQPPGSDHIILGLKQLERMKEV